MIKEAKGFGATIDEAKENAIKNLNASDFDDIQFDIVSLPKKKVLGIFGGGDAEVRAYIELPDKKNTNKRTKKEKVAKKPEKAVKETPVTPVKEEKPEVKKVPNELPEYDQAVDCSEISADSCAGKAVAYIKTVLENLNCGEISIKVASRDNGSLIILDGEDISILIGRRGETLDALQYLAGLAANNGGGHYKISLNIGNYREKREETLIALAKRLSAQALKAGKCRTLEPMNPYERRIIHTAVQAIEGVESASFGEGSERRVVIAPIGVELKPRMSNSRRGGSQRRPSRPKTQSNAVASPTREPKKDSDIPLYGKIN